LRAPGPQDCRSDWTGSGGVSNATTHPRGFSVQLTQRFDQSPQVSEIETTTVTGRVDAPFYQGGSVSARVRQAKETNNQLKKEVEDAWLRVHAGARASRKSPSSTGKCLVAVVFLRRPRAYGAA
jgi:outer membrane protein TolC